MKPENNLDCSKARELMFEYLDGECSDVQKAALEAHLSICGDCACELEERKRIVGLIKSTDFSAPAGLYSSVMSLVGTTAQDRPSAFSRIFSRARTSASGGRSFVRYGSVIAACAVLMLVIVGRGAFVSNEGLVGTVDGDTATLDTVSELGEQTTENIEAAKFASPMTTTADTDAHSVRYSSVKIGQSSLEAELKAAVVASLQKEGVTDAAVLVCGADALDELKGGEGTFEYAGKTYTSLTVTDADELAKLDAAIVSLERAGRPFELYLPKCEPGQYRIVFLTEAKVK